MLARKAPPVYPPPVGTLRSPPTVVGGDYPSEVRRSVAPARAAVSMRRTLGPRETRCQPPASNDSISAGHHPPSGPTRSDSGGASGRDGSWKGAGAEPPPFAAVAPGPRGARRRGPVAPPRRAA